MTSQKMFSIIDFFGKYDQIRRKLQIWSHLLRKSLMENFIFLCSDYFYPSSLNRKKLAMEYDIITYLSLTNLSIISLAWTSMISTVLNFLRSFLERFERTWRMLKYLAFLTSWRQHNTNSCSMLRKTMQS